MTQTHKGITGDNCSCRSPLCTLHSRNLSQSKLFQKKRAEKGYASALLETAPTLSLSLRKRLSSLQNSTNLRSLATLKCAREHEKCQFLSQKKQAKEDRQCCLRFVCVVARLIGGGTRSQQRRRSGNLHSVRPRAASASTTADGRRLSSLRPTFPSRLLPPGTRYIPANLPALSVGYIPGDAYVPINREAGRRAEDRGRTARPNVRGGRLVFPVLFCPISFALHDRRV